MGKRYELRGWREYPEWHPEGKPEVYDTVLGHTVMTVVQFVAAPNVRDDEACRIVQICVDALNAEDEKCKVTLQKEKGGEDADEQA